MGDVNAIPTIVIMFNINTLYVFFVIERVNFLLLFSFEAESILAHLRQAFNQISHVFSVILYQMLKYTKH